MKIPTYCLRPTVRLSNRLRDKFDLDLGQLVFLETDKKKMNYRVLPGYKNEPEVRLGYPMFKEKKMVKLMVGGEQKFKKQAVFDKGKGDMAQYNMWYYDNADENVVVVPRAVAKKYKLKYGSRISIFKKGFKVVGDELEDLLGDNAEYVMPKKGIYFPHPQFKALKDKFETFDEGKSVQIFKHAKIQRMTFDHKNVYEDLRWVRVDLKLHYADEDELDKLKDIGAEKLLKMFDYALRKAPRVGILPKTHEDWGSDYKVGTVPMYFMNGGFEAGKKYPATIPLFIMFMLGKEGTFEFEVKPKQKYKKMLGGSAKVEFYVDFTFKPY
jgi:hypothetical protein